MEIEGIISYQIMFVGYCNFAHREEKTIHENFHLLRWSSIIIININGCLSISK